MAASTPIARAIRNSPFCHGFISAFASVEEDNPASRETAAKLVPRLRRRQ